MVKVNCKTHGSDVERRDIWVDDWNKSNVDAVKASDFDALLTERDALAKQLAEVEAMLTKRDAHLATYKAMLDETRIQESARRGGELAAVQRAEAAEARVLELEAAIQGAYGWLWLVNNEPGTPNQFEPEKAAYKARKVLRALLTHEQRGDGINRAMQEHRASPSARTALDDLHQMDHEDSKP